MRNGTGIVVLLLATVAAACASRPAATPTPTLKLASALMLPARPLRPRAHPAALPASIPVSYRQAAVAIVIDDMGDRHESGERALKLPGAVTFAFLPQRPFTRNQAMRAHERGKEVMVHLPVQPEHGGKLLPTSITRDLGQAELQRRVALALDSVPFAQGLNNHEGSLVTQNRKQMDWLMQALLRHGGLYFVDSRTSGRSVAYAAARDIGLQTARRDIFLDDRTDAPSIRAQWNQLLEIAEHRGTALAIGHPHPQTLAVLEEELPKLQVLGVRLVPASELIRLQGVEAPARGGMKLVAALSASAP